MIPLTLLAAVAAANAVTYEQFGAKGDGVTDDLPAIVAAHEAANAKGLPVKARDGARYYLHGDGLTAKIMTDTDFGTAKFTIDDRKIRERGRNVFDILPSGKEYQVDGVKPFRRGMTSLGVKLPARSLVQLIDREHTQFRRTGDNQFSNKPQGYPQRELLVVDPDGSIDPRTEIVQDMLTVSKVTAWPIDVKPLTVSGGHFVTISTDELDRPGELVYYSRGIGLYRSNVKICGFVHDVVDEVPKGMPYGNFLHVSKVTDVMISNCVFQARRKTVHGTYDFNCSDSACVTFADCRQSSDIHDGGQKNWWIGGFNYCRDMSYIRCELDRYDAHCGTHNGTIRDCRLRGIFVIGSGKLLVENSAVEGSMFIWLRSDYGSNWDGDIVIRNCRTKTDKKEGGALISVSNDGTHDYGYPCFAGRRIAVDGFRVENGAPGSGTGAYKLMDFYWKAPVKGAPYALRMPEVIAYRDFTTSNGLKPVVSNLPDELGGVRIVERK